MTDYLKKRPWIWIIVFLGVFVAFEGIFFYVAGTTAGGEFDRPAVTRQDGQLPAGG